MTAYTDPLSGDTRRWTVECAAAGHPRWDDDRCWCREPHVQAERRLSEPAETISRARLFRGRL